MADEVRIEDEAAVEPTPGDDVPGEVPEHTVEAAAAGASLEERLDAAESKAAEHLNDLKRLAAEFDNYRKRAARDQESLVARAHERLVKELLPVLDDLERALDAANEHEEARLEEGVRLVHRSLADVLRREGLAEIETDGRFDPHVHEALLAQPSELEEGSVIQVLQKGFRLGDRVLRPARVVVSAGPPAPAAKPPVRESGPGEGARGNREVPPTNDERESGPGLEAGGNREVPPVTDEPASDENEG